MQFKNIIGQNALKQRLIEAVEHGRISHAQLFLGKNGFGSLLLAIAYAQYISCKSKSNKDSCGECISCKKFEKLIHPDLHFSFPINKNDQVKSNPLSDDFIKDWRTLCLKNPYFDTSDWYKSIDIDNKQGLINVLEAKNILKKLSLKPFESEFKFLIIWRPEQMNNQTSNKLLKLIEEPTDKTIILLVAEDEEQLLKTITSRTQIIRVPPIDKKLILSYLIEQVGTDSSIAKKVADSSLGDLNHAVSKVNQEEENQVFFNLFKSWMRACYKADIQEMTKWVEGIASSKHGREERKRFVLYAIDMMREGMILNYSGEDLQGFLGEEQSFVKNFAPFVHSRNILEMNGILNEAFIHISRNAHPKILFMDLSMKFANLLHVKNVHL